MGLPDWVNYEIEPDEDEDSEEEEEDDDRGNNMQRNWAMRFRGEKESIQKLTTIFEKKQDGWGAFTRKKADDILFRSNMSGNINGMWMEFLELVKAFPELEAAYIEKPLDVNYNFWNVYYSAAGGKIIENGVATFEYNSNTVLFINCEDGYADVIEAFIEDNGISKENAEKLVALFKYERGIEEEKPEPFAFNFYFNHLHGPAHFDSERGFFACQFDGDYEENDELETEYGECWIWVPDGVNGKWIIGMSGNDAFIRELIEEAL